MHKEVAQFHFIFPSKDSTFIYSTAVIELFTQKLKESSQQRMFNYWFKGHLKVTIEWSFQSLYTGEIVANWTHKSMTENTGIFDGNFRQIEQSKFCQEAKNPSDMLKLCREWSVANNNVGIFLSPMENSVGKLGANSLENSRHTPTKIAKSP